ncbi:MAG: BamA/TamA family outer membrane protein [Bacteroides sp.]|nr:BamA/TamA family outer membrane protein [Ruminococcus flavefaciens]MCM1554702.1 BamA/TamA family outer membrane protein [Bacteroides sp.]
MNFRMSARRFSVFRTVLRACLLACIPLLSVSCNNVAHLSPDQSLLVKNKVKVSRGGEVSKMDMTNMLIQEPNSKILGARIRLGIYNGAKPDKHNWWNNKLRELGEPPVVFDSSAIVSSQERILMHAASKGYFYPELTSEVKRKGKMNRKVVVSYNLRLDEPYRLRDVAISVLDDSLQGQFDDWEKRTLLKPGMQYKVSTLDAERSRIAEKLQNLGYWAFSKDYVSYSVDSSLNSKQMDVLLLVKKMYSKQNDSLTGEPILLHHKKYYIDNVYLFPQSRSKINERDFDTVAFENVSRRDRRKGIFRPTYHFINQGKPIIKYKPLLQKTFLRSGDLYSLQNVSQTYNNLGDLRVFQYNSISFTEKPYDTTLSYIDNNRLDCNIHIIQGSRFGFSVEGQLTTSSGIQGIAAVIGFQNRNTFGGGEILNLKLRGVYEFQVTADQQKNKTFLNTFEVKAEASLEFPRFLLPISLDRFSQYFRPSSIIAVSYSYQLKRDYSRGTFNATFGYRWRQNMGEHVFNPIEISTIQMGNLSERFEKALQEYQEKKNYRLYYQYSDHFILTPRYRFTYNDQRQGEIRDFNRLKVEVEVAGSLLYGIAYAIHGEQPQNAGYKLFNLPFSQYTRAEVDYAHHFTFGEKTSLVLRADLGVGYSYGNSKSMPYEKAFFAGGNNSLRAWPLYQLGPGGYAHPKGTPDFERLGDILMVFNIEQRFPIVGGLRGAVFLDAGNIWLFRTNETYPNGVFSPKRFYKEFALGTGLGLRYDFKFFLIRMDIGVPLRDPSLSGTKDSWVIKHFKLKDLIFNFGIGYPF